MPNRTLLERLGLHRPELRAWAMYDWANSAMVTTIITAVFPIYFSRVAAAGLTAAQATYRLAIATTIGLAIIAVLSPILGAVADQVAAKKRILGIFLAIGVIAVTLMFFIERGDWLWRYERNTAGWDSEIRKRKGRKVGGGRLEKAVELLQDLGLAPPRPAAI